MSRIQLHLSIPDSNPDDGGNTVRVAVRDTTQADALHQTVAEAIGAVTPDGEGADVSIDLPEAALDPLHRYSVWAHVDRSGNGALEAGDLITAEDVPVGPRDIGAETVEVPLTRI